MAGESLDANYARAGYHASQAWGRKPARNVGGHFLRRALQRIAPTAAAPSVEMQDVSGFDMDAIALGRNVLGHAVLAHERLG